MEVSPGDGCLPYCCWEAVVSARTPNISCLFMWCWGHGLTDINNDDNDPDQLDQAQD